MPQVFNSKKFFDLAKKDKVSNWLIKQIDERFKNQRNLLMVITGETGCLPLDTEIPIIVDDTIFHATLRDLKKKELINVLSYNFGRNMVEPDFAKVIDSGRKEMFEVEFESGRIIRASKEHKFFVFKNSGEILEKTVSQLKKGDRVLRWK